MGQNVFEEISQKTEQSDIKQERDEKIRKTVLQV